MVSNFIIQALQGEPITIYGDGSQTRSFCYVDDLVEGSSRLMERADEVTGPINLGNPGEFTILELAEKVIQLTGSTLDASSKPLPAGRSEAAPARHQPRPGHAGMGAGRPAGRGPQGHYRIFPNRPVTGSAFPRLPARSFRRAEAGAEGSPPQEAGPGVRGPCRSQRKGLGPLCGISGIVGTHWEEGQLQAMVDAIAHRGPNGEGIVFPESFVRSGA